MPAVVQPDHEVLETEPLQHVGDRGAQLGLDDHRSRADGVDVALIELAKPPARRPVRPPHRLDLVALEEPRQLPAMLGDDAGQRHREVVAQREVGFARRLVLAAAQHLENELVAFFAVLARQRLDVLERRRLERLEAVAAVDVFDDTDDVFAAAHVLREEIAHPTRGTNGRRHPVILTYAVAVRGSAGPGPRTSRSSQLGRSRRNQLIAATSTQMVRTALSADRGLRTADRESASVLLHRRIRNPQLLEVGLVTGRDRSSTSASRAGSGPSHPCSTRSPACRRAGAAAGTSAPSSARCGSSPRPGSRAPGAAAGRASSSPAPWRRRCCPCARSASPSRWRWPSCGRAGRGCWPDSAA